MKKRADIKLDPSKLIDELKRIIIYEIKSDELLKLNENFYNMALNNINEFANKEKILKLLNIIQYIRLLKIIEIVFTNKDVSLDKMTYEERLIVDEIRRIYSQYIVGLKKAPISVTGESKNKLVLVVFEDEVPKISTENISLGPFSKGDVIFVPVTFVKNIPCDKIKVEEI
ncbi:MAG: hypothetical protein DRJ52_04780 [Thermoprotei archaeon]|nr:MAG: hypothetical protein DRJ52_04780 [Thermoprotei archaeon]